ncbi:MAG: hypothetical protein A2157_20100 [Deltaproteobacteria bacterium RBG_16_47_11]|nr:MAG: hypothetical protein A2157_20100 [Deltaproteobacteria bacterium RBG_16_47_11]
MVTYEMTPLNPSRPPFTKGGEQFFPPFIKGGEGGFFVEGPLNTGEKYVTEFMKYSTKLRWFVTLTFSMSASYDFGDTPWSVSHLPIISHLPFIKRGKPLFSLCHLFFPFISRLPSGRQRKGQSEG